MTEIRMLGENMPETTKIYWLHKKVLKCKYCEKATKLKHKRKYGLAVNARFFKNPLEANKYVVRKNGEQKKINKYV